MKCLVLGGNGFIGSHLTRHLQEQGHEVVIYGHKNNMFNLSFLHDSKITFIEGDFLDFKLLRSSLHGIDIVYHLISTTIPSSSNKNPIYDAESNIIGTLELLDSIVNSAVQKTIFVSSGGTVYGRPIYTPIDEKHPTNPDCAYGISKLAIEKYFILYQKLHQLDHTILRVSNPYGEFQNPLAYQGVIAVFIYQMLTGKEITIWGDGEVTRDYIYIQDVCTALVNAISHNSEKRILNIASGQGYSLNDIIQQVSEILDIKPTVNYTTSRNFDVPINVLDNRLAKSELNWSPENGLKGGLRKTVSWYQTLLNEHPHHLNLLK